MTQPLSGRLAVVTGASRGIGREVALQLAAEGAHVIAIARTQGGLEELDDAIQAAGGSATLVPLDVRDYDALDRLGATIHERWGKLDIFVGNGGILGALSPIGHIEPKEWDQVIATNLTANYRLIRSLDPLLQLSDAGRVVLVSSGASWNTRAYWGLYGASKAGLDALGRAYAAENSDRPLKIMVFNPGPIRTRMRAQAMPGEDPMTLPPPKEAAAALVSLCRPDWRESGKVYDFPTKSVKAFHNPA